MQMMWISAEYIYMVFKFLCGGVSAGVNKSRKLNSQAHVDVCFFYSAGYVWEFLLLQLYFCMPEERGCESTGARELRCESAPSLSVMPSMYAMWPARVVMWVFFFLPVQGTDMQTMKKLQLCPKHSSASSFWLLDQIAKGFKAVISSHSLRK